MIATMARHVWLALYPIGLGALIALGQAPFWLWWLAFLSLGLCFFLGRGRGFFWGWRLGLGYFGLSLNWIAEPFFVDPATIWMAPFAVVAMAGGLALFWGAAFAGSAVYWRRTGAVAASTIALIVFWAGAEWLRSVIFTGFAWAQLAYVIEHTKLEQIAAITGPYGLTFLVLVISAIPAVLSARGRAWGMAGVPIAVVVFGGAYWIGAQRIAPVEWSDAHVRVIQPNAPQHQKWDPEWYRVFYERALDFTKLEPQRKLDLIVWPETSYSPRYIRSERPFERIYSAAEPSPVLVGYVDITPEDNAYNTAALFTQGPRPSYKYYKFHLVPFGEYIPFEHILDAFDVFGLAQFGGDFTAGDGPEVVEISGLGRVQILICYEAVFTRNILKGDERPDVLIHMTNDAWFGTRSGPYQHFAQARFRAIEHGVPVIRAANTGVSSIIDPYGNFLSQIPLGHDGIIDENVPKAIAPTPYSRFGNLPLAILMAFCVFGLALYAFERSSLDRNRTSDYKRRIAAPTAS